MQNIFIDVLPPWVETGLQPAFYDLESGTVLQQTARMYAKVRELTEAFNTFSENVTEEVTQFEQDVNDTVNDYIERFNQLHDYVHDYFDNLDVQEEINNKLDAMVEDGTFETLLANYLVICGANAKKLGCKGDGETDDTSAINTAITNVSALGVNKLVFPSGTYVISDTITIPSNFELIGMKDSVIKYVGEGTNNVIFLIDGQSAENYKENIVIDNITIDGSEQEYKGGYSSETPKVTHTNPYAVGIKIFRVNFAKNVTIKNCTAKDVYGDGIIVNYSTDITIDNNSFYNVSSGNIQLSGQTGYDNHGDGIAAFASFNVSITNNTIINRRVYQAGIDAAEGKPCGRSGIEFEYPLNINYEDSNPDDIYHNAVDYDLVSTTTVGDHEYRRGNGLTAANNYVYGYTKGIHLESNVEATISSNTVVHNHIGILTSTSAKCMITTNHIDTDGVGKAPQSGYDGYYGCIAITSYVINEDTKTGIITGNTIIGDGRGIVIARDKLMITNNNFRSKYGVFCLSDTNRYIIIANNVFNDHEVDNFENFIYFKTSRYCSVLNNLFTIVNTPTYAIYFSSTNTYDLTFKNNMFNAEQTLGEVVKLIDTYDCNFDSNKFNGECTAFIRCNTAFSINFTNNSVSDILNGVLKATSGFYRFTQLDKNVGSIVYSGYAPNETLAQMRDGYFNRSQVIYKGNITSESTIRGWSCLTEGIYTDRIWSSSPVVGRYYLNSSSKVYKCEATGSESPSVEPTHESGSVTETDGFKWLYVGAAPATFKTFGF